MTLRRILIATSIAACIIAEILLAGLFFTVLQTSGFLLLPEFGLLGTIVFLQSFPLFPLTILIVLTLALAFLWGEFIVRRSTFLNTFFALIALILIGGFLVSLTPVFSGWQPPVPHTKSFVLKAFLRGYGTWRFHNVYGGTVTGIRERTVDVRGTDGNPLIVELSPSIPLPLNPAIGSGDTVLIIGERRDGFIRAFGIRKVE